MASYTENQIISAKQAGALLGWSAYWTRVRAKAGDIPYIQPRKKMGFRAGDIAAFIGKRVEEL